MTAARALPAEDMPATIEALIADEIAGIDLGQQDQRMTVEDFRAHRVQPEEIEVNFSGGIRQVCWTVTRNNGPYRVIYLPTAGYFSLCIDGAFGPTDIGVHGPAVRVFGAV